MPRYCEPLMACSRIGLLGDEFRPIKERYVANLASLADSSEPAMRIWKAWS